MARPSNVGMQTQPRPVGQDGSRGHILGFSRPRNGSDKPGVPLSQDLLVGAAAGILASVMTGAVDRLLGKFVSQQQKQREKRVRQGSPHELAGPRFGEKLLGRKLTQRGERQAQRAFGTAYGIGWGLIYALVRRQVPQVSKAAGLPFAVPFFLACDGALAPLLKLTPTLEKVPWQLNVKELLNHTAWTVSAEMAHRLGRRIRG